MKFKFLDTLYKYIDNYCKMDPESYLHLNFTIYTDFRLRTYLMFSNRQSRAGRRLCAVRSAARWCAFQHYELSVLLVDCPFHNKNMYLWLKDCPYHGFWVNIMGASPFPPLTHKLKQIPDKLVTLLPIWE